MTIPQAIQALGLKEDVTKVFIKKAYRQAAQTHHPDKSGSADAFKRIKSAYDLLMKTSIEDIRAAAKVYSTPTHNKAYDPFTDVQYHDRHFFKPDNPQTEGFERASRARGCSYCHGIGTITKNTDPSKGFLGLETRLCRCQWI